MRGVSVAVCGSCLCLSLPQFLLSYDTNGDGELSLMEFQVALEADPFLMAQFSAITAVPVRLRGWDGVLLVGSPCLC